MTEPSITINGGALTTVQAMTIRVAIEHFAVNLQSPGDDEHGRTMTLCYLTAIQAIRGMMHAIEPEDLPTGGKEAGWAAL